MLDQFWWFFLDTEVNDPKKCTRNVEGGDYIYLHTPAYANRNGFPNPTPQLSSIVAGILLAFYLLTYSQLGRVSSTTAWDLRSLRRLRCGGTIPPQSIFPLWLFPFQGKHSSRFGRPSWWLTYGDNKLSLSVLAVLTSTTTTEGSVVRTLRGRDMY